MLGYWASHAGYISHSHVESTTFRTSSLFSFFTEFTLSGQSTESGRTFHHKVLTVSNGYRRKDVEGTLLNVRTNQALL